VPLDNVVFWVFAPVSVASAIGMLTRRNAIHAALFLVVNFFCLSVMYLLLDAPFLFAVQVIVYAGAIMVLFLFVIMLLGVDRGDDLRERLVAQRPLAIALGAGVALELFFAFRAGVGLSLKAPPDFAERVNVGGNAQALAKLLFRQYFFPFEVTSILLIVAAIAAMVLGQRRARVLTQAEIERRALRDGGAA
jgi:NADH-quinone oxidoreductase subunit J